MRGINKFIGVGSIGADPDTKYTQSGEAVCNFSIATNEEWTDKQTGQKQSRTEWHKCVAFKQLAEIINQYGRKGQTVYVEGKSRTRKWQSQSGEDHYTTSYHLDVFTILHDPNYDSNAQNNGQPPQQQNRPPQQPQQHPAPPPNPRHNPNGTQRSPYAPQPPAAPNYGGFDDEIPFT